MSEMNIQIDHIFTGQDSFGKYVNKFSTKSGIKLAEQMIVFVIEPTVNNVENLIFANLMLNNPVKTTELSIIFIPAETPEIIEFLISMQHLNCFEIYSFSIDIIPTDYDLFSMDAEDSFREIYIDKNYSSIGQLANILLKFEVAFGKAKYKYIKGDLAKYLGDALSKKEEEHNIKSNDEVFGMIILDRSIDFITPLLMNLTYEGMINELFGIEKGCISVKKSLVEPKSRANKNKNEKDDVDVSYPLTLDANRFYCKLRCFHFLTVNNYLNSIVKYARQIKASSDDLKTTSQLSKALSEFNKIVDLQKYANINIGFLDIIFKNIGDDDYKSRERKERSLLNGDVQLNSELYYDDYISEKKDLYKILNLMILESLTQGGIKNYESLKKDILTIYGYQNIFLFRNLETLGWIKEKDKISLKKLFTSNFQQIVEKLNLINRDFKLGTTDDISYVSKGYCPISLKLVEKVGENGWSEIKEGLQLIPGETVFPNNEYEISNPSEKVNTIFVVFLGGVTYAEIEGIRYLNRKYKQIYDNSTEDNKTRKQFIIVTTQILSSKKLYDSLGKNFGSQYTIKKFYNDINNVPVTKKK